MIRLLAITMLACLVAATAHAQEEAPPEVPEPSERSEIRDLIERSGILMVERRIELPPVPLDDGGRIVVSGVGAFEPGMERQRTLGVRIDLQSADAATPTTYHYLDLHEVETLLRALAAQDAALGDGSDGLVTETRYATTEGFRLGTTIRDGKRWHRIQGADDDDWRTLGPDAFRALRARIAEARDRLFNAP